MRVVYFDNAATSWPKPAQVAQSMAEFLAHDAANPGRSGHRMAVAASGVIEGVRGRLAALINAEGSERVVLCAGCTAALNIAIHSVLESACDGGSAFRRAHPGARPHAVTTMLEHKAVARPLVDLEQRGLIDLDFVTCDSDGFVDPAEVLAATNERTLLVAVTHASNAVGTIQDVAAIGALLRRERPDALLLVDAAQTVGAIPVDVRAMGADLLAFPGHKGLLGPTGVGGLYVGPRAYPDEGGAERMRTLHQGGTGGGTPTMEMPTRLPNRFEPGTPNTVGFAGLLAAMEHAPGAGAIEHERAHIARITEWAQRRSGARVVGTPDVSRRMGVVALVFEGRDPKDVARGLDARHGVACRAGDHCATNSHIAMGTAPLGTLRLSAGPYTTSEDVDALLAGLEDVLSS